MTNAIEVAQSKETAIQSVSIEDFKKLVWPAKMDRLPTEREVFFYTRKWQYLEANPLTGDVVLVPFDNKKTGKFEISEIFSKEYFLKRANEFPTYKGFKAGITLWDPVAKSTVDVEGEIRPSNGYILLGGWCEVLVKGKSMSRVRVRLATYKKEYSNHWTKDEEGMIRKVAIVHAFREAFPKNFEGTTEAVTEDEVLPVVVETDPFENFEGPKSLPQTPLKAQEEPKAIPEAKTPEASPSPVSPSMEDAEALIQQTFLDSKIVSKTSVLDKKLFVELKSAFDVLNLPTDERTKYLNMVGKGKKFSTHRVLLDHLATVEAVS